MSKSNVECIEYTLEDFGFDSSILQFKKPIQICGVSYSPNSKLITDDDIYHIDILPLFIDDVEDGFFKDDTAYLSDSMYYLYRGECNSDDVEGKKPGIYKEKDPDGPHKYFIIQPVTDEEKEEYNAEGKVNRIHLRSLIDSANENQDILIAIPENTKIFQPQITENDDILKVIAKKALLEKNVDLDRYKDRFSNKNELFNFKQVLRSENKVSMKIFMRAMEALNLVFTIIVTEKSANNVVGDRLTKPIETSSEETYQMCA